MFNRRLVKTIIGFIGLVTLGLVGFLIINKAGDSSSNAPAKAELPNR